MEVMEVIPQKKRGRPIKENAPYKNESYYREYYAKNKKKIECPCGGHFYNTSISIHNKTEIHKTYLKIKDLENRLKEAGL